MKVHCLVDLHLFWWGRHCCRMLCDLFKIYCAPPNLGITMTWLCWLKFAQKPIFFQGWCSLTSLKSQTRDPQLKVLVDLVHVDVRLDFLNFKIKQTEYKIRYCVYVLFEGGKTCENVMQFLYNAIMIIELSVKDTSRLKRSGWYY